MGEKEESKSPKPIWDFDLPEVTVTEESYKVKCPRCGRDIKCGPCERELLVGVLESVGVTK